VLQNDGERSSKMTLFGALIVGAVMGVYAVLLLLGLSPSSFSGWSLRLSDWLGIGTTLLAVAAAGFSAFSAYGTYLTERERANDQRNDRRSMRAFVLWRLRLELEDTRKRLDSAESSLRSSAFSLPDFVKVSAALGELDMALEAFPTLSPEDSCHVEPWFVGSLLAERRALNTAISKARLKNPAEDLTQGICSVSACKRAIDDGRDCVGRVSTPLEHLIEKRFPFPNFHDPFLR
jgi:hypothetical protein